MKFILSTLVFGAAASASAFDLFDGQQETPRAPEVVLSGVPLAPPVAQSPHGPPATPTVRVTPATPSAPAAVWVTTAAPAPPQEPAAPTASRGRNSQRRIALVQDQDDDLKREAEKLEAEVARLRQMLEEMRGEVAQRGSGRSAPARVRVRRELADREAADRGAGTRVRVREAREHAEEAMDRAKQAQDRAAAARSRARNFAEQAKADAMASKEKAKVKVKAKARSEAKQGADVWVERAAPRHKETAERILWATSTQAPDAPNIWTTDVERVDAFDRGDGRMIVVRKSGDGESVHETHTIKKSGSGGASTFNIHVEDGDVHIYAGSGPAGAHGGGGSFTFGGDLPKGAFAPKVMGIGGGSGGRFFFKSDDDDDDEHEHEHADDDDHEHEHDGRDHDDDDRFVDVRRKQLIGIADLGSLAELDDLKNLHHLGGIAELIDVGIDLEALAELKNIDVELGDFHGLEGMLLDVTSGLDGLGENIKVEVKVVGPDGKMIHHHGGAGMKGLLGDGHRNVIIEYLDEVDEVEEIEVIEEEEEVEDEDRFVIRANPIRARTQFGLSTPSTPSATGNHAQPAGFDVRDVSLDQELLELAREIQQEVRAMRAELDELRRQVLGSAPKAEAQPRARGLRPSAVRNTQRR